MTTPLRNDVAGPFLRTTVLGGPRAVDVVLPTGQAVASLVPVLTDLLRLPEEGVPRYLVTLSGRVLPAEEPLAAHGLKDGVQLRLLARPEAPSDPVVYDLVDAVEEERPRGEWGEAHRGWALTSVLLGVLLVALSSFAVASWAPVPVLLGCFGLICLAVSAGAAYWPARPVSAVLLTVGWASLLGAGATQWVTSGSLEPWWVAVLIPIAVSGVAATMGRPRAALSGLVAWLVLAAVTGLTWVLTTDLGRTAAVVSVISTAVLGLLPRAALATTGAFAVDSQLGRGAEMRRRQVVETITTAHLSMLAAVVVTSVFGGVALYLVAVAGDPDPWRVALAGVGAVAWLVRSRHFPLVAERLAVAGAGLGATAGSTRLAVEREPALSLLVLLLAVLVAGGLATTIARRPNPLVAASARRWAARAETVTVLAGIPLLVGASGVYADLLNTF